MWKKYVTFLEGLLVLVKNKDERVFPEPKVIDMFPVFQISLKTNIVGHIFGK